MCIYIYNLSIALAPLAQQKSCQVVHFAFYLKLF